MAVYIEDIRFNKLFGFLDTLDLAANHITDIDLNYFPEIRNLNLTNNGLYVLECMLCGKLESINISQNQIIVLNLPDTLGYCIYFNATNANFLEGGTTLSLIEKLSANSVYSGNLFLVGNAPPDAWPVPDPRSILRSRGWTLDI